MEYKFIGSCYDPANNHDKVWGVIYLGDHLTEYRPKCLVFWGRRGKKLQTKLSVDDYEMTKLIRNKELRYTEVTESKLHSVYPEFQADLEKTAMWATLSM